MSCVNNKTISATFDAAESLMQERPDSALYLLQSLDGHNIPQGALQARYALLYAQAFDKNYLPLPAGDSLINVAIDYYSKKNHPKLGWAYLYLGVAYSQMDSTVWALIAYMVAQELANKYADYTLLSAATSELGDLHQAQRHYNEALELYKLSLAACRSSGNQKNEGYALGRIGDVFYLTAALDSAEYYYSKAREIAIERNDGEFLYMLSASQAAVLRERKEYTQSKQLLFTAIREYKQGVIPLECYPLLSTLYHHSQQIDSARHYMLLMLHSPQANAEQRAGAYEELQKIEEQACNFQMAQHYTRQYKALSDSIRQVHYVNDLRVITAKYEHEKSENESFKYKFRLFIRTIVFCLLIVSGTFVTRHLWKRGIIRRERHFSEIIAKQDEKIEEARRSFFTIYWNVDLFLKSFDTKLHYPTKEGFHAKAIEAANIAYPGFIPWLKKCYPNLSIADVVLACLLFAGLGPKDFNTLYQTSDLGALYTRCSRLYQKLGIKTNSNEPFSLRNKLINRYILYAM